MPIVPKGRRAWKGRVRRKARAAGSRRRLRLRIQIPRRAGHIEVTTVNGVLRKGTQGTISAGRRGRSPAADGGAAR